MTPVKNGGGGGGGGGLGIHEVGGYYIHSEYIWHRLLVFFMTPPILVPPPGSLPLLYITFQVLRSLMALTKLQEKSFNDVVKALLDHYEPKQLVISECFNFNRRQQGPAAAD